MKTKPWYTRGTFKGVRWKVERVGHEPEMGGGFSFTFETSKPHYGCGYYSVYAAEIACFKSIDPMWKPYWKSKVYKLDRIWEHLSDIIEEERMAAPTKSEGEN